MPQITQQAVIPIAANPASDKFIPTLSLMAAESNNTTLWSIIQPRNIAYNDHIAVPAAGTIVVIPQAANSRIMIYFLYLRNVTGGLLQIFNGVTPLFAHTFLANEVLQITMPQTGWATPNLANDVLLTNPGGAPVTVDTIAIYGLG